LRAAAEDWLVAEVREVVERWPRRWRNLAAQVDVPVHLRLAEHDRVWASSPAVVARMASAFLNAPQVDAELLPGGGHLYEATKLGPTFIAAQLDFIERHASP
jgi:pimeloyl-ACP methyl ester carboxylesterase